MFHAGLRTRRVACLTVWPGADFGLGLLSGFLLTEGNTGLRSMVTRLEDLWEASPEAAQLRSRWYASSMVPKSAISLIWLASVTVAVT
jgi:hypothetical protein